MTSCGCVQITRIHHSSIEPLLADTQSYGPGYFSNGLVCLFGYHFYSSRLYLLYAINIIRINDFNRHGSPANGCLFTLVAEAGMEGKVNKTR